MEEKLLEAHKKEAAKNVQQIFIVFMYFVDSSWTVLNEPFTVADLMVRNNDLFDSIRKFTNGEHLKFYYSKRNNRFVFFICFSHWRKT